MDGWMDNRWTIDSQMHIFEQQVYKCLFVSHFRDVILSVWLILETLATSTPSCRSHLLIVT